MALRGRKSSVASRLRPEFRRMVDEALLQVHYHPSAEGDDGRFRHVEDVHTRLELAGQGVSIHALRRYAHRLWTRADLSEAANIAGMVGEAIDATEAVRKITKAKILNLLTGSELLDSLDLCRISNALSKDQAVALQAQAEDRKQIEWSETRRRAEQAAERVQNRLGKRVDAETLRKIREEIYGIVEVPSTQCSVPSTQCSVLSAEEATGGAA